MKSHQSQHLTVARSSLLIWTLLVATSEAFAPAGLQQSPAFSFSTTAPTRFMATVVKEEETVSMANENVNATAKGTVLISEDDPETAKLMQEIQLEADLAVSELIDEECELDPATGEPIDELCADEAAKESLRKRMRALVGKTLQLVGGKT